MKDDHALPKFIKPGDDPKLDRIIAELKAEPPGIGHGHDVFGRRLKPPPGAAPRKPVMATPAGEAAPVSKPRRRGRWIALGVLGIVGPIVVLALGRSRGPSVVVGPVPASVTGALPAENTAALAPVVAVPAPVPSAAASVTAAPSAEPVRKPGPSKRKPQRTADAGSAEAPLSSELYQ